MKKTTLFVSLACLASTLHADPLLQWISDNASGGTGNIVDATGSAIPVNSDWLVELINDSTDEVLFTTTAGFLSGSGQFIETPEGTAWNGISVRSRIYDANSRATALNAAYFANTGSLSWGTDPAPPPVVLYNAGRVVSGDWVSLIPEAQPGNARVDEDDSVMITLVASGVDGDPLTYAIASQPTSGAVSLNGNVATYTPDPDYNGADSFTFTANDGNRTSAPATVSLNINAVNDAPTAIAANTSVNEDGSVNVTLIGGDIDGDTLTFAIALQPGSGSVNLNGAIATYQPSINYFGADSFTFVANDGTVDSPAAVVSVTVFAVNDPPVAAGQSQSVNEDGSIVITLAGSDVDGDNLTYAIVNQPANGGVSLNGNEATYNPAVNYNGADSFTFKVNDGTVDSGAATVSMTVLAANDPPVANGQVAGVAEDGAVIITLTGSDVDGDALTYAIASQPANGGVVLAGDQATYTPSADFNGTDAFSFTVNDGTVDSASANVSVNVSAVNDDPVFTVDPIIGTGVATEDAYSGSIASSATDVDSGDTLTFSKTAGAAWLIVSTSGVLSGTPAVSDAGNNQFTVEVADGHGGIDTATLEINVIDDDAPTPGTAAFASAPVANDGTSISMVAQTGSDMNEPIEYYFAEVSGNPGGTDSGWQTSTAYTDSGLTPGTQYAYTVQMRDALQNTGLASPVSSATTIIESLGIFDDTLDVGTPGVTGSASESGGVYTVAGGGNDIWNGSDNFRFIHKMLVGDGQVVARVDSVENTNPWAKAGVMLRNTTDSNSAFAMVVVTPAQGVSFQYRTTAGANAQHETIAGVAAPQWVRMTRVGDVFSGEYSADGTNWTAFTSRPTITMSVGLEAGLCVTAHNDATTSTAQFSGVDVYNIDVTAPDAPSGFTAVAGDASVALDWSDNAEPDFASYNVYRSTSSGTYGTPLQSGLVSSDFNDLGTMNGITYYYVVTAVDSSGNESVVSTEVSALPISLNPELRITEYYLTATDFSGTNAMVTLDQDLANDYYILVRGSREGSGLAEPDNNYARVSAVPGGKGDLAASAGANQIELSRYIADFNWEGVVTVVECLNPASPSGFSLVDVAETTLNGTVGTDTVAAWSDISRVVLFGGYRGGGAELLANTTSRNHGSSVYVRLYPSGSDTLNWSRNAAGETLFDAVMTTFVVEWGSEWNVQHVNVAGNNGGGGADAVSEYTTAAISAVARSNTWVWATGTRADAGIGDCAESCLVTLGDGVSRNASESTVAIGSEYTDAYDFDVYVLSHASASVDYVFVADGNGTETDVAVAVSSAVAGARFGWVYNGVNGTGTYHPRDMFWARYTSDTEITISRGFNGQNFPAWVQAVDLSGLNQ